MTLATHCEYLALGLRQGSSASSQFVVQESGCTDLAPVHHWQAVQVYQSRTQRGRQDCCLLCCADAPALSARACLGCARHRRASFWRHHRRNQTYSERWTLVSHLHWPGTGCYMRRKRKCLQIHDGFYRSIPQSSFRMIRKQSLTKQKRGTFPDDSNPLIDNLPRELTLSWLTVLYVQDAFDFMFKAGPPLVVSLTCQECS